MLRRRNKDTLCTNDSETNYCRVLYPDYEYTAAQLTALMASKKKRDLEIVYNLQWKTRSNGDDKQANIIGVYDVPQTTLNWETFKSYLLKNSGTTGDDVKVSYMSDNGEVPVNSQRDFQIALYTFRKKARNGEVITLWLDRISEKKKKMHLVSDAQTQASGQENKAAETSPNVESVPPEWFKKYMKQFKHEFMDEMRGLLAPILIHRECNHMYRQCSTFPSAIHHHVRKSKHESKRSRQGAQLPERDVLKGFRIQNKLESKLEKLERKTLKLKEKSLTAAARSSDSDAGRSSGTSKNRSIGLQLEDLEMRCDASRIGGSKSRPIGIQLEDLEIHFNAKPVKNSVTFVPHMVGGETYMQQWEVCNVGDMRWDSDTDLRFAWGHEALIPAAKTVRCPKLEPGEQGLVSVVLQVPNTPGQYESYWHFHHKGRRFGHWLGCQIIVDPSPVRNSAADFLQSSFTLPPPQPIANDLQNPFEDHFDTNTIKREIPESPKPLNTEDVAEELKNLRINEGEDNDLSREEKVAADDTNCSSDSDNQSIISIADTNTSVCSGSSDEFVIVPTSPQEQISPITITDVEKINEQDGDSNNNNEEGITQKLAETIIKESNKSGYAYVNINGKKLAVPKCFLHDEFLATAEDAPDPSESQIQTGALPKRTDASPQLSEEITTIFSKSMTETKPTFSDDFGKLTQSCTAATADNVLSSDSHCSAAGSNFSGAIATAATDDTTNSRLFVFPAGAPGFEIVSLAPETAQEPIEDLNKLEIDGAESPLETTRNEHVTQMTVSPNCHHAPYCYYPNNNMSTIAHDARSSYSWANGGSHQFYPELFYSSSVNPYGPLEASNEHICLYPQLPTVQPTVPTAPVYSSPISPTYTQASTSPIKTENVKTEQKPNTVHTPQQVHLIPENLMTGAVNVASSAINTAKSVLQMIAPTKSEEPGKWVNGHWITMQPESNHEAALNLLAEMGFTNRDYNASLLNRYEDDIEKVIADLLTAK